ncbi:hypothetical protein ABZS66_19045 [Dactylosporangium sp. NPDC005572]|uniref:hypothetical protein n=1 Tax=Dactylosporangium sp. NPDC005572 TaxID=3156889 RepID=UPI0033B294D2
MLRWEEPPDSRKVRAAQRADRWRPLADELRARPGEWAVIAEGQVDRRGETHAALAAYIRAGMGPFAPARSFETKARTAPAAERGSARVGKVWARYVGGDR